MLNLNEEQLTAAIVQNAADQIIAEDRDLSGMVAKEVKSRIDKIFADRVSAQITEAIDAAIKNSFQHQYQKVSSWGQPIGDVTTIGAQLEATVNGYWTALVDPRNGEVSSSAYNSVSRAEYVMTKICAEDFSKIVQTDLQNITGALKDGLRNQIAKLMDGMLNDLFKIKSLQDQGKVEKPY